MTRVLRRLGFPRQTARPHHPKRDVEARGKPSKGGLGARMAEAAARHPDKRIELGFEK